MNKDRVKALEIKEDLLMLLNYISREIRIILPTELTRDNMILSQELSEKVNIGRMIPVLDNKDAEPDFVATDYFIIKVDPTDNKTWATFDLADTIKSIKSLSMTTDDDSALCELLLKRFKLVRAETKRESLIVNSLPENKVIASLMVLRPTDYRIKYNEDNLPTIKSVQGLLEEVSKKIELFLPNDKLRFSESSTAEIGLEISVGRTISLKAMDGKGESVPSAWVCISGENISIHDARLLVEKLAYGKNPNEAELLSILTQNFSKVNDNLQKSIVQQDKNPYQNFLKNVHMIRDGASFGEKPNKSVASSIISGIKKVFK